MQVILDFGGLVSVGVTCFLHLEAACTVELTTLILP